MGLNPRGTFSTDLSLFGSRITDILATDLPSGVSPDNQNVWFQPGMVATRPAFSRMLASAIAGSPNIVSVKEFVSPSGDLPTAFVDSNGAIWINDSSHATSTTLIGTVAAGLTAKFANAFDKLWAAFYSPSISSAFSTSPFVGAGVPIYYNGQQINRVTSDAPGITPSFANVPTLPYALNPIGTSTTLTISSAVTAAPIKVAQRFFFVDWIYTSYYTQMIYTATSAVPASWINTTISVSGLSGTNSSIANISGQIISISGNTFTLQVYTQLPVNLTGQSGSAVEPTTIYLTRQSNTVTAWIGGATVPAYLQPGFWSSLTNGDNSIINGPDWTITSIARATTGLVTVVVSTQLTNLPVGTQLYIDAGPTALSGNVSVTNGSPTVSLNSGSNFLLDMVGQTITINSVLYTVLAVNETGTSLTLASDVTSATGNYAYTASVTTFPAGFQTVYQVISVTPTSTTFVYQDVDTTVASSASGSVYQQWTPQLGTGGNAAQITGAGIDATHGAFIQFFQLGPDTSLGVGQGTIASPFVQIQGQIPPGLRNAVMMFQSPDGQITAPSPIVQIQITGGAYLLNASNIPIGPIGWTRILAFTPYNGSSWYYIVPVVEPAIGNSGQTIVLGTIVNDDWSTSATIDFSDAQLTSATQIDATGNDLFNQFVLPPALGVQEYAQRLHWWGLINNVRNLDNMGFDGGYAPPSGSASVTNGSPTVDLVNGSSFLTGASWNGSTIVLGGVAYTIAGVTSSSVLTLASNYMGSTATVAFTVKNPTGCAPPGWTITTVTTAPSLAISTLGPGFSCVIPPGNGTNPNQISQEAYQDEFGAPIVDPSTNYGFRFLGQISGAASALLTVELYSPTQGVISLGTISVSATPGWCYGTLGGTTPANIPPDLQLIISGALSGVTFSLDELELIDADEPIEQTNVHSSYVGNPFGYDAVTGVIGIDAAESITAMFRQRGYVYILTDQSLYQGQASAQSEPAGWTVNQYATACGCSGPNAVDPNEDVAFWSGRYGGRIFNGNPSAKKISQEIASDWENHNWNYQTLDWVANDPVERIVYFGIVQKGQTSVSAMLPMNYRLADDTYNVPDPIHTSAFSGKMIATDLGRKWTLWTPGMNLAAMCTRPGPNGLARQMVFAGSGYGNLYTQDTVNFPGLRDSDDDFGPIDGYYTTYFFPEHLLEQNPQLSQYRKFFGYAGVHATGVGKLVITPYVGSLSTPWPAFPPFALKTGEPGFDYQVPLNVRGDRMALEISTQSLSGGVGGAFVMTHLIFSGAQDKSFPVRGSLI